MLTSIRNALAVGKTTVSIPFSNLKYEIAKILKKAGFVDKVEKRGRKIKKRIIITLKYSDKTPAINGLQRVSKQGRRVYLSAKEIKPVREGRGIVIVSTSKGLMTDKEARRQKLGGEVICEVW